MNTSASAANQVKGSASTQADRDCEPACEGQRVAAEKRWYVARTQRHAEGHAVANLEKQNFRTFYPRFRKSRRHARRVEIVLAPLFPNYIFVELDLSRNRWRSVNSTRGVTHMLMQGEMPQAVARGVVESLQLRMRVDGTVDLTPRLEIGQSVRVAYGPFADFVGTLHQLDSAGRVRVLLSLLGRSVSVALNGEALLPAG